VIENKQELIKLGDDFLERLYAEPGGEYVRLCAQCGMCVASCPSASRVDYPPRKLISLLRAGRQLEVLTSNSMWLCLSCYLCSERCPRGVVFPALIHALQRLVNRYHLPTYRSTAPKMYQEFISIVENNGRNHELYLLLRYYFKTNPLGALKFMTVGLKMLLCGRLVLRPPKKIKGFEQLKLMLDRAKAMESGK
jgi:heterodisulfide reductase subunit C